MQIQGFDPTQYDEWKDNFTLIINRRILIEMVEYYNSPNGIFHLVVSEIDPDSGDTLCFERDYDEPRFAMTYDQENLKAILEEAYDNKHEALARAYSLAASYQA